MAKRTALDLAQLQRRLAAVGALCGFALTGVRLKKGDSAKLARAEDDLAAAVLALSEIQTELAKHSADAVADTLRTLGLAHTMHQKPGQPRAPG